jgi:hypothetical protein
LFICLAPPTYELTLSFSHPGNDTQQCFAASKPIPTLEIPNPTLAIAASALKTPATEPTLLGRFILPSDIPSEQGIKRSIPTTEAPSASDFDGYPKAKVHKPTLGTAGIEPTGVKRSIIPPSEVPGPEFKTELEKRTGPTWEPPPTEPTLARRISLPPLIPGPEFTDLPAKRAFPTMEMPPIEPTLVGRYIPPPEVLQGPDFTDTPAKRAGPTLVNPPTEPTLMGRNILPTEVPPTPEFKTEAKRAGPTWEIPPTEPTLVGRYMRYILPTEVSLGPEFKTEAKRAVPTLEKPPTEPTLVGRNIHPTAVPTKTDPEAK